jgi:translocation protein SEC62
MLALRVVKIEPQGGSGGKKPKRVKGQWTVKIEREQEAKEEMYYAWLWEGSQLKRKVYAALALVVIFAIVLYPLWPLVLRKGVYHLSWGLMGLLALFFAMAIFRVILFCITYFVTPPGLWLFPNLWEDVSFVDSFKPVWAWHEVSPRSVQRDQELELIHLQTTKPKKKKKSQTASSSATTAGFAAATGQPTPAQATTTGSDFQIKTAQEDGGVEARKVTAAHAAPTVEELGEDED